MFLIMSKAAARHTCKPTKSWRAEYVYKYGRIDTPERLGWLKQILLQHQLYIPRPGELNDPKEARPKIAMASIGKFIRTLQTYFIKSQPPMTPAEEQYHRAVIDFNLRKHGTYFVIDSFKKGLPEEFVTQRIYSLSKRPNNLHLWKKYAFGHRGYCLEFRNAEVFKDVKEVRYKDYFEADVTGPVQLLGAFYYYKTTRWRREEELRIVGRRSADSGTIEFNPLLLTRIILGKKMTGDHQALIREWAEKRAPALAVELASDMVLV